ncbi:FAD-binding oxidoreductase, partial [Leucobacter sp. BZR 635]
MTTPPTTAHAFDPMVLVAALDSERVLTDPAVTGAYAHDDAEWAPFALPLAVVLPRSTEEVAEVVRAAVSAGVAVVPRGAGTGLSGGANSSENAIVVSLELMQDVLQVDVEERYAVTQAGVINDALRARVA